MKNFKRIIFSFFAMFMVIMTVNAKNVADFTELETCLTTTGNVCTLSKNVELDNTIEIAGEVALDLNGYVISLSDTYAGIDSMFVVLHGGKLTVNDSSAAKTGKITTENNANVFVGIKMTKAGGDNSKTATLIVNGGTIEGTDYAISGNGNLGRDNTDVTVNGGTLIGGTVGIFQPNIGKVTINGGKITGATGIEMRAGELVVNGGEIIATATEVTLNPSGNGASSSGVGIAIMQHTTKHEINVVVKDGEVKGAAALYQSNIQNNDQTSIDKISINVEGGNFEATNENEKAVYSENIEKYVVGGTFNTELDNSAVSANITTKVENGITYVGEENDVNITEPTNGTVKVDKNIAVSGQIVNITATPNKGYEIDKILVKDAQGSEIKVTDNSFVMSDSEVDVTVTFKKVADAKEESATVPAIPETPKTGDSVLTYVILGMISIGGIFITLNELKKRYN